MEKLINDFKISFTKGDTYAIAVKFKKIAEDLTSAFFTVKENPDDEPLIQKSLGAGIDKIDDREYKKEKTYKVQLQAIDTADLEANVQYLYDLRVTLDNVVKTVLSGVFVVHHSVTGITSTTTATLEVVVDDEVETELLTTPATKGIEYEQDPVANGKIGDLNALSTTNKGTVVQAINEVNGKAGENAEDIRKLIHGGHSAQHAIQADDAEYATNAEYARDAESADEAGYADNAGAVNGVEIKRNESKGTYGATFTGHFRVIQTPQEDLEHKWYCVETTGIPPIDGLKLTLTDGRGTVTYHPDTAEGERIEAHDVDIRTDGVYSEGEVTFPARAELSLYADKANTVTPSAYEGGYSLPITETGVYVVIGFDSTNDEDYTDVLAIRDLNVSCYGAAYAVQESSTSGFAGATVTNTSSGKLFRYNSTTKKIERNTELSPQIYPHYAYKIADI